MDFSENVEAHARFVGLARQGHFSAKPDETWTPETVVAHLIATDRVMTACALELIDGRTPTADNRICLSLTYLGAIASAAAGFEGLINLYEQSGRELAGVAEALAEELAQRPIPVYIVDNDVVILDGELPLATLLSALHIDGHGEQLSALSA